MPNNQDPAAIAAGLTEAQREAILGDANDDMPFEAAGFFIAERLFKPVSLEPPRMEWTAKGEAVRDYLTKAEPGGTDPAGD
ncbi:MAG: hypothetical protein AAGE05_04285 [Pseudomonadota bacterium]